MQFGELQRRISYSCSAPNCTYHCTYIIYREQTACTSTLFRWCIHLLWCLFVLAGKKYMFTLYELSPVYEFSNMGSLRMMFNEVPLSAEVVRWCFHSWSRQHSASCPTRKTIVWVYSFSWMNWVSYVACDLSFLLVICKTIFWGHFMSFMVLFLTRKNHLRKDNCLEDKRGDHRNCCLLYWVLVGPWHSG